MTATPNALSRRTQKMKKKKQVRCTRKTRKETDSSTSPYLCAVSPFEFCAYCTRTCARPIQHAGCTRVGAPRLTCARFGTFMHVGRVSQPHRACPWLRLQAPTSLLFAFFFRALAWSACWPIRSGLASRPNRLHDTCWQYYIFVLVLASS